MRRLQTQPMPDSPRAWLLTATKSAALDLGKSDRRRIKRERAVQQTTQPYFLPTADAALSAGEVEAALHAVPDDLREAVVLRIWAELSFEQIAELIGTSTSTAHDRHRRGLAALRRELGDDHD